MWEVFFSKETILPEYSQFIRTNASTYFMLDNAVANKNIAEVSLLSILLLQNEFGLYKEMYNFYKGLTGLVSIGLEDYARNYAMEENYYFLAK